MVLGPQPPKDSNSLAWAVRVSSSDTVRPWQSRRSKTRDAFSHTARQWVMAVFSAVGAAIQVSCPTR